LIAALALRVDFSLLPGYELLTSRDKNSSGAVGKIRLPELEE